LPRLLGWSIGATCVMEALVILLFMDFIPLSHGVSIPVVLAIIILVEQVALMPDLVLWPILISDCLGVLKLGILDCGSDKRLVLKFSFFCLLVLN